MPIVPRPKHSRIDHVFVDPGLTVVDIEVPSTEYLRLASDHLPLIVELQTGEQDRSRKRDLAQAAREGGP